MSQHQAKIKSADSTKAQNTTEQETTFNKKDLVGQKKFSGADGSTGPNWASVQARMNLPDLTSKVQFSTSTQSVTDPRSIHRIAASGLSGPSQPLPYLNQIQKSFGSYDISNVHAYTGDQATAANRAMGSEAYASGNKVAFTKKSLFIAAHESAHVVQQRGGVQLHNGIGKVNDYYEFHANEIAKLVAQGKSAESYFDTYSENQAQKEKMQNGSMQDSDGYYVQRLAAQIISTRNQDYEEEESESEEDAFSKIVIKDLLIAGRPPSPFVGTMGDHTTAFIVQVEALKLGLQGKSYKQAIEIMDNIVEKAKELPGIGLVPNLRGRHKEKYQEAEEKLDAAKNIAAQFLQEKQYIKTPLAIQEYVAAYLHFRELIPLSTLNIAAKSPALAGKGKGESEPVNILKNVEEKRKEIANINEQLKITLPGEKTSELNEKKKKLLEDIKLYQSADLRVYLGSLFDKSGVAIAAAERDEYLAQAILPGSELLNDPKERIDKLVEQHFKSLGVTFPYTLESSHWNDDKNKKIFFNSLYVLTLQQLKSEINFFDNYIKLREAELLTPITATNETRAGGKIKSIFVSIHNNRRNLYQSIITKLNEVDDDAEEFVSKLKSQPEGEVSQFRKFSELEKEIKQFEDELNEINLKFENKIKIQEPKPNVKSLRGHLSKIKITKVYEEKLKDVDKIRDIILQNEKILEAIKSAITGLEKTLKDNGMSEEEIKKIQPNSSDSQSIVENDEKKARREQRKRERKNEKERESNQSLTTQIYLNKKNRIGNIKFAGRSKSPFGKSMGAHTTAWIVHQDVILTKLKNKTTSEAINIIADQLFPNAKKNARKRIILFLNLSEEESAKLEGINDENYWEVLKELRLKELEEGSSEDQKSASIVHRLSLLQQTEEGLNSTGEELKKNSINVLGLQQYINLLLTYINYIPGATFEATDVNGKNEARYRKLLRDYESDKYKFSPTVLAGAIRLLIDVKVVPKNYIDSVWGSHLEAIENAYPKSYTQASNFLLTGIATKKKVDREKLQIKQKADKKGISEALKAINAEERQRKKELDVELETLNPNEDDIASSDKKGKGYADPKYAKYKKQKQEAREREKSQSEAEEGENDDGNSDGSRKRKERDSTGNHSTNTPNKLPKKRRTEDSSQDTTKKNKNGKRTSEANKSSVSNRGDKRKREAEEKEEKEQVSKKNKSKPKSANKEEQKKKGK